MSDNVLTVLFIAFITLGPTVGLYGLFALGDWIINRKTRREAEEIAERRYQLWLKRQRGEAP